MYRVLVAGVLLGASGLSAQITTYVPPPRPQSPAARLAAVADSLRRDSVRLASVANMRAWVDSASGVSLPKDTGELPAESSPAPTAVVREPAVREPAMRPRIETFKNGSVAPDTASNLPTLTIVGVAVLALGAGILSKRSRE